MKYRRAPITEAVIELRFARPADRNLPETAAKRAKKNSLYAFQDQENVVELRLDAATGVSEQRVIASGVKLSSADRTDSLMFRTNAFVCSRLAPYHDWAEFKGCWEKGWAAWKAVAGPTTLIRIGVRYINRIDVPVLGPVPVAVRDYITVAPGLPLGFTAPLKTFAMQITFPAKTSYTVIVNTSFVPSPLIDTTSFALDIDVARETELPIRDDLISNILDEMRILKNELFESFITDASRKLFQ